MRSKIEVGKIGHNVKFAHRRYVSFISIITVCFLFVIGCDELPSNPVTPENTKCSLVLKTSYEKCDETYIEDSTNKVVSIGMRTNFPQFVDSMVIVVKDKDSVTVFRKTEMSIKKNENDTTWIYWTSAASGTFKINLFGYVNNKTIRTDDAKAVLYAAAVANRKPTIVYTGRTTIAANATCSLVVTANDSDINQVDTLKMLKGPAGSEFKNGIFKWTPGANVTGVDSVTFIATDNGVPSLSATLKVMLNVSGQSGDIQCNLTVATYDTSNVTFIWEAVTNAKMYSVYKSESKNGTFVLVDSIASPRYTDSLSRTVRYYVVKAYNGATALWTSDTLASSRLAATDIEGPVITFPSNIQDGMLISTKSLTTTFNCFDTSGVVSVRCSLSTVSIPVSKVSGTSATYTVTINGISADTFSVVKFSALDNSFRRNIGQVSLRVKTTSTAAN